MSTLLWQPKLETIADTNMQQFINYINKEYHLAINNYSELYQWSIDKPELFWPAVGEFCQVKFSQQPEQILVNADKMPGAQWFVGAKLNFAENLLRIRSNQIALISKNENNLRKQITYYELYEHVAQLASALRKMGIKANDRIAGFLPNISETIIAMLATTSIGAIWSSCSPDFGTHGVYDRFGQIEPKVIFTTESYQYNGKYYDSLSKLKELEKNISSIEKIIVIPYLSKEINLSEFAKAILYQDFIDHDAIEIEFTQLPFDHPLYILYSSGTTGVPKCIVHGAGGVLLQHLKELMLHTDLKSQDIIFYYTTCGWMMWNWLVSSLATGATIVLYDGSPFYPKPSTLFDLIDEEKISIFGTSAKFISAAEKEQLKPITTHGLNSLRVILSTGSPLLPGNYKYVYEHIKKDICLSSISGGTDIVSCFALGNPLLPVYEGELQCRGLGVKVEVYDENGFSVRGKKGELVCTAPFPCMPIYFWNDADQTKYCKAYFEKFPDVWAHGDYVELTEHDGLIIYGRSDATLNPGGVRIGTAEIYRQVEKIPEVMESIVIDQEWDGNSRLILFVKLNEGLQLTKTLIDHIKQVIRSHASPHHVPAKIIQVKEIPRTLSGKIVELAVREVVHNREVKNVDALANPEALTYFKSLPELFEK